MANTSNQNASSFGWLGAGFSLVTDRVDAINQRVGNELTAINDSLTALSQRGEQVEAALCKQFRPIASLAQAKNKLQESSMPFGIFDSVNPFKAKSRKTDQRIALLSAKVDLLVEQVALLAAKEATARQAAKKKATAAAKAQTTAKEETATKASPAKRTTRAKATTKKPTAETTKNAATKPAPRKTTRRAPAKPKATPAAKKDAE